MSEDTGSANQHDTEGLVRSPEIGIEVDHAPAFPGGRIQITSIDVVLGYVIDNDE